MPFLLLFSPCNYYLMYINLLHLPLFNFAYLFFLSFPLNRFVSFVFIALFPTWHLALVFFFLFQFVLRLVWFLTGKYNFLFPLFPGSIYCTLFLLNCFHFAHECICIYICIFHYFNYYFSDFVTAICLGFIFGFSFLDICFTLP